MKAMKNNFFFEKHNNQEKKQNAIFQLRLFSIFFRENFRKLENVIFVFWLSGLSKKNPNENQLGFHMRYCLFLHYVWFLQNLEKDFIQTNMHTTAVKTICN